MNLSWMDFYDEALIDEIVDFLEHPEFPSELIRFEITETSYAALEENVGKVLNKIKKKGAWILLDDFGSGYSSFNMLQRFSFDILKIDMSFTREIEMVIQGQEGSIPLIIETAHALGRQNRGRGCRNKGTGRIPQKPWLRLHSGILFLQTVEKR